MDIGAFFRHQLQVYRVKHDITTSSHAWEIDLFLRSQCTALL